MKKLYSFFLVLALSLSLVTPSFAAATKARVAREVSSATPTITDANTGNTADVSAAGDLIVRPRAKSVSTVKGLGNSNNERGAVASACTVYSITFTGQAAGALVVITDDTTGKSTSPVFEIEVASAKQTVHLSFPAGIAFSTEVYCRFQNDSDYVTVVYDTDTVS